MSFNSFQKLLLLGSTFAVASWSMIIIHIKEILGGLPNTEAISTGADSSSLYSSEESVLLQQDEINLNNDLGNGKYFYNKKDRPMSSWLLVGTMQFPS